MKRIFLILSVLIVSLQAMQAQGDKLPSMDIRTLDGKVINTYDLLKDGKPVFLDFWATWCKPCVLELNTLADLYEDWQDETGVKIVIVSVDDSRTSSRVAPFVNSRGWEYTVLIDPNSEFKRAMNVVDIPHSFLIAPDGKILWQHTGFAPGDEDQIYEQLIKLSSKTDSLKNK
ncbi:MAG: TlpA family protein disulfide reductase [Chlorobi bacterium]|nr:TlpA family protein disulfide reductase [Chlorobiota bacterium]